MGRRKPQRAAKQRSAAPAPEPRPQGRALALNLGRDLLIVAAVAVVWRLVAWVLLSRTPFFTSPVVLKPSRSTCTVTARSTSPSPLSPSRARSLPLGIH